MEESSVLMRLIDLHPSLGDVQDIVVQGLTAKPKRLPPWLLYDERGSELFEAICDTESYYVTRTEIGILREAAPRIADIVGSNPTLLEFGTGSGVKTEIVLSALDSPSEYVCVDISREALEGTLDRLHKTFPTLPLTAICANYNEIDVLPMHSEPSATRLAFFPGSTLGNLDVEGRPRFLNKVRSLIRANDFFLIGIDLVKSPKILEAAYDDPEGVTAEFNLNLLDRFNRELDADFKRSKFRHQVRYDASRQRIEMHLESLCHQKVQVNGAQISFESGETIHTESSHKFERETFVSIAEQCGFKSVHSWQDENQWFSIELLRAK